MQYFFNKFMLGCTVNYLGKTTNFYFCQRPVAGEVALVTGAGQGIGRQIAYQLGKLKATVICVDINEETNNETVKHIQDTDGVAFG